MSRPRSGSNGGPTTRPDENSILKTRFANSEELLNKAEKIAALRGAHRQVLVKYHINTNEIAKLLQELTGTAAEDSNFEEIQRKYVDAMAALTKRIYENIKDKADEDDYKKIMEIVEEYNAFYDLLIKQIPGKKHQLSANANTPPHPKDSAKPVDALAATSREFVPYNGKTFEDVINEYLTTSASNAASTLAAPAAVNTPTSLRSDGVEIVKSGRVTIANRVINGKNSNNPASGIESHVVKLDPSLDPVQVIAACLKQYNVPEAQIQTILENMALAGVDISAAAFTNQLKRISPDWGELSAKELGEQIYDAYEKAFTRIINDRHVPSDKLMQLAGDQLMEMLRKISPGKPEITINKVISKEHLLALELVAAILRDFQIPVNLRNASTYELAKEEHPDYRGKNTFFSPPPSLAYQYLGDVVANEPRNPVHDIIKRALAIYPNAKPATPAPTPTPNNSSSG